MHMKYSPSLPLYIVEKFRGKIFRHYCKDHHALYAIFTAGQKTSRDRWRNFSLRKKFLHHNIMTKFYWIEKFAKGSYWDKKLWNFISLIAQVALQEVVGGVSKHLLSLNTFLRQSLIVFLIYCPSIIVFLAL